MFRHLIDQLTVPLVGAVDKFLGRAVVITFLLVAIGFVTAAALIGLIAGYGAVIACLALAGLYAVVALLAAAIVAGIEAKERTLLPETSAGEGSLAGGAIFDVIAQHPIMALSTAATVLGTARLLGRNTVFLLIALTASAYFYSQSNARNRSITAEGQPLLEHG
jgi:hypothetical protein